MRLACQNGLERRAKASTLGEQEREPELEPCADPGRLSAMKFVMASLAVLFLCVLIGGGLLLMAAGKGLWLFVLSVVVFLGLFIRYGCMAH
jgi:hypothetical protein